MTTADLAILATVEELGGPLSTLPPIRKASPQNIFFSVRPPRPRARGSELRDPRRRPQRDPSSGQGAEDLIDHEGRPEDALEHREHALPERVRLLEEPHPRAEDPEPVDRPTAGCACLPTGHPPWPPRRDQPILRRIVPSSEGQI